jgi:Na+/melibiose symporter-like transporter
MGTKLIGYDEKLGTIGQSAETASALCWLVAGLYALSAICQFVGVSLVYNIDKKTLATMTDELAARHAEPGEAPVAEEVVDDGVAKE